MAQDDWKDFWQKYRVKDAQNEDDLYFQVGKTVNRRPITKEAFEWMIEDIVEHLKLQSTDQLLEMCCGNGLLTLPLSHFVEKVYAFDFTQILIETAIKLRQSNNIIYKIGDAKSDHRGIFDFSRLPAKALMNDSLGYFQPNDLKGMIQRLKSHAQLFYLTGVPCDELKWNFYNTPERRARYEELQWSQDKYNDGMGRWWQIAEFENIIRDMEVGCSVWRQPPEISTYRINVLFRLGAGTSGMSVHSKIP